MNGRRSALHRTGAPVIVGGAPIVSRFARAVPPVSTVLASGLAALPVVADAPVMPPWGLLVVLGWRLLRPELWRVWVALPLGFADDLLTGQLLGSSMACWTITFLVLDLADNRLMWRDFWLDWAIAAVAITFCMFGATLLAGLGPGQLHVYVPQMVMTILCFPVAERLCAALDRWRLRR